MCADDSQLFPLISAFSDHVLLSVTFMLRSAGGRRFVVMTAGEKGGRGGALSFLTYYAGIALPVFMALAFCSVSHRLRDCF